MTQDEIIDMKNAILSQAEKYRMEEKIKRQKLKELGYHIVTFNLYREYDKSFMVYKKTKKRKEMFFVPKSIIKEYEIYTKMKNLPEQCKYEVKRIAMTIPTWFCEKELGFYS